MRIKLPMRLFANTGAWITMPLLDSAAQPLPVRAKARDRGRGSRFSIRSCANGRAGRILPFLIGSIKKAVTKERQETVRDGKERSEDDDSCIHLPWAG